MAIASTTTKPKPLRLRRRTSFVERTISSLAGAIERSIYAEEIAQTDGWLQSIDPRVKVAGMLLLLVRAALSRNIFLILGFFGIAVVLALVSRVPLATIASRVWIGALIFTGTIAFPAIFITPGEILF